MKIASNNQPNLPRSLGKAPAPAEKNPYQMDQFELQQEVWDSQREVANVRAKIQTGQTTAVAGMGVLFTSLGIMAAQSILSGGLSAAQMIPVGIGAATGLTLFSTGIWKRDTNEMNLFDARLNHENLQNIYDKRFPS
ncbi:hypothetical protein ABS71_15575 [bacterium SCN 62-11]|nr:hypothetical protein [Candidatus Eremiobacteraeota bacterium]ODT62532.1 MAG: hypothetical protein ABS71_15575 [bacterium SCN 62-11]